MSDWEMTLINQTDRGGRQIIYFLVPFFYLFIYLLIRGPIRSGILLVEGVN